MIRHLLLSSILVLFAVPATAGEFLIATWDYDIHIEPFVYYDLGPHVRNWYTSSWSDDIYGPGVVIPASGRLEGLDWSYFKDSFTGREITDWSTRMNFGDLAFSRPTPVSGTALPTPAITSADMRAATHLDVRWHEFVLEPIDEVWHKLIWRFSIDLYGTHPVPEPSTFLLLPAIAFACPRRRKLATAKR